MLLQVYKLQCPSQKKKEKKAEPHTLQFMFIKYMFTITLLSESY
jgi:hypothetical protein